MLRFHKLFVFLAFWAAVVSSYGFALLGPSGANNPAVPWQTPAFDYNLPGRDIGGPMNIDEGYRWNMPVITYGFDQSFISYFGTNGMTAVENAVAILNNLPRFSQLNLDDFPYNSLRVNNRAAALELWDLKSSALVFLVEELGLTSPQEYVFAMLNRAIVANGTVTNYYVTQRNFDPVTHQPSSYINGALYSYTDIFDDFNGPPPNCFPRTVKLDPFSIQASVAGQLYGEGGFFTGLTYDDVGGLQYLYSPTNLVTERLMPGLFEVYTNTSQPEQIETLDLALLIERTQHTTNDVATLHSFPGYTNLHLISTNAYLTNLVTTNIASYFTNFPYALGSPPQQVFVTNYVTNVTLAFDYGFDNVITNSLYTKVEVTRKIDVVPSPDYQPGLGSLITNITYLSTNTISSGDFYFVPFGTVPVPRGEINTNIGYQLISTQTVNIVSETNLLQTVVSPFLAVTNTNTVPIRLDTLDLGALYTQTHWTTNDPNQVLALYPGLRLTQTNAHFANQIVTNIYSFFTNYPSPIPPGPLQVFGTNYETNVVLIYDYSFGNVVINGSDAHFTSFGGWEQNFPANPPAYINGFNPFPNVTWQPVTVSTLDLVPAPDYMPGIGNIRTNVLDSYSDVLPIPTGDFFIVPTNVLGYITNSLVLTGTTTITNTEIFATSLLMTNELDQMEALPTLDLTTFIEQTRTNDPAALLSIPDYADLVITTASNYLTNVVITNYVRYLTNYPYDPAGSPPHEASNVFLTYGVQTNWVYTFANVITNTLYTSGRVTLQVDQTEFDPYAVAGSSPTVDSTITTFSSNFVNGTIYIVPTNLFGYEILGGITNIIPITNVLYQTTNFFQTTNVDQALLIRYFTNFTYFARPVAIMTTNDFATNDFGLRRELTWNITTNTYDVYPIELVSTNDVTNTFSRTEIVSSYTSMTLGAYPIKLTTPRIQTGIRPGIDKLTFVRMYNQTTFSTNYIPFETNYVDTIYIPTNNNSASTVVKQTLHRVVLRPDIIFSARDLGFAAGGVPVFMERTGTGTWDNNNALNAGVQQAGPGVIPGDNTQGGLIQVSIVFNKVGPYTYNFRDGQQSFLTQAVLGQLDPNSGQPLTFAWGSFDGTTNAPIVFPVGTSISDLEAQVLGTPSP